jgi:ATP-dependent Clp protease protease subunit
LDEETSAQVCRKMIEMNVAGEVEHIQMVIDSSGAPCTAGFAVICKMEWSRVPVYITGLGIVASKVSVVAS